MKIDDANLLVAK